MHDMFSVKQQLESNNDLKLATMNMFNNNNNHQTINMLNNNNNHQDINYNSGHNNIGRSQTDRHVFTHSMIFNFLSKLFMWVIEVLESVLTVGAVQDL